MENIGKKEVLSMNKSPNKIGLIAEDDSDIICLKILIRRITGKNQQDFDHFVGRGCGKIIRKSFAWSKLLKLKGCNTLIVVHDLVSNNQAELSRRLETILSPYSIKNTLICIPIREIEAWLISDPEAIKIALNLRKLPKEYYNPEKVDSPKETLSKEVERASNNFKLYNNVKHNPKIANQININLLKSKCASFNCLYEFANAYM